MKSRALSTALATLSRSLDQRRIAHAATLRTTAPLFTPFAYVRKGENSISKSIGDLLDPKGLHSQGPLFLRIFLDTFALPVDRISAEARVTTESTTTEGRRIDIVIHDRDWIVGIENKPWAPDGELQVTDYLKDLRSRGCASATLIYLTKDGRLPSFTSISNLDCQGALASDELKLASYSKILAWLATCGENCHVERVRNFLCDFGTYLREEVMGVQTRKSYDPVVDSLLSEDTREYLPVALEIAWQKDALRDALLARLLDGLRERLTDWTIAGTPMAPDNGLGLTPPDAHGWYFCVELDSGKGQWCYGLKVSEVRNSKALTDLGSRLRDRYPDAEGNSYWLMWLWFDDRTVHDPSSYSQWENDVRPWVDMADGTMARNLAALAIELHKAAVELTKEGTLAPRGLLPGTARD